MRLLVIFIYFLVNTVYADVYQSESNGSIIYSDSPINSQQQIVSTGTINSVNSKNSNQEKTNPMPATGQLANEANKTYEVFSILSPKDQETIQNQPTISVAVETKPKLQVGDKIQVILDGKAYEAPVGVTTISLNLIYRGIHQLSARLLNKNNQVIKETNTITIYVHRASVNAP